MAETLSSQRSTWCCGWEVFKRNTAAMGKLHLVQHTSAAQTLHTQWQETCTDNRNHCKSFFKLLWCSLLPQRNFDGLSVTTAKNNKLIWGWEKIDMCASACLIVYVVLFLGIHSVVEGLCWLAIKQISVTAVCFAFNMKGKNILT